MNNTQQAMLDLLSTLKNPVPTNVFFEALAVRFPAKEHNVLLIEAWNLVNLGVISLNGNLAFERTAERSPETGGG